MSGTFGISWRIAAADEFYDGAMESCVYGDIILSAGRTFFLAGYDGAPLMDGQTAVDYTINSLMTAADALRTNDSCRFAVTYENDSYLCFKRNGDELDIIEMDCCSPADDFIIGGDIPDGEEICRETVGFEQFCAEISEKAGMFIRELDGTAPRLMSCAAAAAIAERVKKG